MFFNSLIFFFVATLALLRFGKWRMGVRFESWTCWFRYLSSSLQNKSHFFPRKCEGDHQELNSVHALVSGSSGNHTCRYGKCRTGPTVDGRFTQIIDTCPTWRRDMSETRQALDWLQFGNATQQKRAKEYFKAYGQKPINVAFLFFSAVFFRTSLQGARQFSQSHLKSISLSLHMQL